MTCGHESLLGQIETHYQELVGIQRSIKPSDSLTEDLGIDSLRGVELLIELERSLGVRLIGDERLQRVRTVEDLLEVLASVPASAGSDTSVPYAVK